jgi:hypothetical protein
MDNESINSISNKIAEMIIDKSFWGNEWFFIFSLLLISLISAACAWGGSYLSSRAQNAAIRADFEKALQNLEKQTNAVKTIEENITHGFIEKRELLKVMRSKIEELYLALQSDLELLSNNILITSNDTRQDLSQPDNKVEMLACLYFKDVLEKEIEFFRIQRKSLISRIKTLAEENLMQQVLPSKERVISNPDFLKNYNQAKINIELALEGMMKKLTNQ